MTMFADFSALFRPAAGVVYLVASLLLLACVLNGYVLLARCLWTRERLERERRRLFAEGGKMLAHARGEGTAVVTQLPLYNEATVGERVIRAAASMEWPYGPHTVQVLDDSTDETRGIVDAVAAELRAAGRDVVVVRRAGRMGFKAGALAYGLTLCDAEFIAVFDGDFVPPPDFLLRTVPALVADRDIGWVQGRWTHLNADDNTLTRAQAAGIDAHFVIEQQARAAGWFMNFNGTAGVWRRRAIEDAGGWSDATLTEDLDLSYRAHPWRVVFARLNALLAAGTGPALTNVRAAIEALLGRRSEFIRTPKQGGFKAQRYRASALTPRWLDATFGLYAAASIVVCLAQGWLAAVPMLLWRVSSPSEARSMMRWQTPAGFFHARKSSRPLGASPSCPGESEQVSAQAALAATR